MMDDPLAGQPLIFLGIDGGQTATLAVLCDETGRLLGVGRAGPSNHLHEPGGPERLRRALHNSLFTAWQAAGLPFIPGSPVQIEAAFCGMTGGGRLVTEYLSQAARIQRLEVDFDLITAHAGAFLGAPGVIVIGGTGSVAYGQNESGHSARAGGWAHLMGDEGSGYDIGRQALVAAARVEDGRGPSSRLHADLLAHFKTTDFWELRSRVYSPDFDRRQVAGLAPLVSHAAAFGDQVAMDILGAAGRNLAELALAVLDRLGMDKGKARVAPVGGVFRAGSPLRVPFERSIKHKVPQAILVSPALPPALGAALLALRMAGIGIQGEVQKNLIAAASQVSKQD